MWLRSCVRYSWLIQGRGLGVPPPLTLRPNWGPNCRKFFFGDRTPLLISESGWPFPPPPPIWRSGSATVSVNAFKFSHTFTICEFPIILLVCSLKIYITFVFHFSWVHVYHSSLREIEDNAYAKFSGATKVYYGRFANGECNCKLSYINFNFFFLRIWCWLCLIRVLKSIFLLPYCRAAYPYKGDAVYLGTVPQSLTLSNACD